MEEKPNNIQILFVIFVLKGFPKPSIFWNGTQLLEAGMLTTCPEPLAVQRGAVFVQYSRRYSHSKISVISALMVGHGLETKSRPADCPLMY